MVVTEGVVALVVTGELVILHMGVEEKLVILSTGEEEELVILPMGEEEELVISGVTILSSSASVVSSARLAAAQSLSVVILGNLLPHLGAGNTVCVQKLIEVRHNQALNMEGAGDPPSLNILDSRGHST